MNSSFYVNCSTGLYQVVVKLMDDSGVDSIDQISPMFSPHQRDPRISVLYVSSGFNDGDVIDFLSMIHDMKGVYVYSVTHVSDNFIFGHGIGGSKNTE